EPPFFGNEDFNTLFKPRRGEILLFHSCGVRETLRTKFFYKYAAPSELLRNFPTSAALSTGKNYGGYSCIHIFEIESSIIKNHQPSFLAISRP
ncbi:MAG: hypothetical protein BWK80_49840, partial [Desulfobacteraceae bacterium IS3]